MVTRLAREHGQLYAIVTAPAPAAEVGLRFLVVGDGFTAGEPGVYFTGTPSGRPNTVSAPRRTNRDPLPVEV